MRNLYEILEIKRDASDAEIKKAYKKQALKYHPDQSGETSSEKFMEVHDAYEILGDKAKRTAYDLANSPKKPSAKKPSAKPKSQPNPQPQPQAKSYSFDPEELKKATSQSKEDGDMEVFNWSYQSFTMFIESLTKKNWTKRDQEIDKQTRAKRFKEGVASSLDEEVRLMGVQKEYLSVLYDFKKATKDLEGFNPYYWIKEIPSNLSYYDGRIEYYKARLAE